MTMQEIKKIAKTRGLIFRNAKKNTIIRAIQRTDGNNDCFGAFGDKTCCAENCIWKEDCFDCSRGCHGDTRTKGGSDSSYALGNTSCISGVF